MRRRATAVASRAGGRLSIIALAGFPALLAAAPSAEADITSAPLVPATPRVIRMAAQPSTAPIRLKAGPQDWHGRRSHLAGTAHYDRGEWIYEDYPWSAYGAAPPGAAQGQEVLALLGETAPQARRLPGGMAEAVPTSGAGPFADEADLSELRLAVRGSYLFVLARTTTMRTPVRTGLLLLFDTGRSTAARAVPFGSGLQTTHGDIAVLVTAAGARIVDLVSGAASAAPAAAKPGGYANALAARLPLGRVALPGGAAVRLVAATGLVATRSFTLDAGGAAGPLAKVVPRFDEPVQSVYEREQALALAGHDIDRFFTVVSLTRLRRGDRERLRPGIGYSVRTMTTPASRSKQEGGTDGTLRDYGLYVPSTFSGRPSPATLLLRGSGMSAHSLAAITPALVSQLGDDNGAIVVSPGGRSGFDDFEGAAYLDALQALGDARLVLPIDQDRVTVAGYSMGGFATYMLAATQPDRFAAAFVVEGPVGGIQPATANTIVDSFPDVVPALANLTHTPIAIHQTEQKADVPITNALAAAQRLRESGLRYRLDVFPGDHFTPGVINDYTIGAQYLNGARRTARPGEVRFIRSMAFERAIDTGAHSNAPLAGHSVGLRFDHAWFVHDLQPSDRKDGTAKIDVRTLARAGGVGTPVRTLGTSGGGDVGGAPPSVYDEQHWQSEPITDSPRNALEAHLTGVANVALDLAAMDLTTSRHLRATISTTEPVTVSMFAPAAACVTRSVDGGAHVTLSRRRMLRVTLAPGEHRVDIRPAR
jgi:pimeloyl-ACP methyl ester carboxylesterase